MADNNVYGAKDYTYVLFDLDGTLTDSGPGIMNGYEYALGKMGVEIPDRSFLRQFVGPPLGESWEKKLGFSPDDVQRGIALYREYYADKGVYENEVYPGVKELLSDLKSSGKKMYIATTKAEPMAKVVAEHFGLLGFFDEVVASTAERKTKIDVLKYVTEECDITDISKTVMVGDRHYDITGARHFGLDSIGVLYGYGDRQELEEAGATYIAETVPDIRKYIL
ncbi:MAG: HAD-IA family hydrolase [Lachnospiraceae bacterium]|nr:HAD-IA family hydrolase [Lachnospiraceae bacterium]